MRLPNSLRAHRSLIGCFRLANLLLVVLVSGAPWVSAQHAPTLKFARRDLTVLGQTIGKSTHAQVEDALGKMELFKTGGEGSDAALCYRSIRGDDTVVVFYFGALGGWDYLTKISISRSRTLPWPVTRCVVNRSVQRSLVFLRGLKLGSSAAEVGQVLGPATRTSKNRLYYYVSRDCESQEELGGSGKPTPESPCEVVDSVDGRFAAEDGLIYISFYQFIDR